MFKKWRYLSSISLLLANKKWKVDLIWEENRCFFGNGWEKFARECKVEAGDELVFFGSQVTGTKTVNVVIFKRRDEILNYSRGKRKEKFYKRNNQPYYTF